MKKVTALLILLAFGCFAAGIASASNVIRISQVYGGGGATAAGPPYSSDYVELFNFSGSPVDISGWSLEYGSAAGSWGSSAGNIFTFPQGTVIPRCGYLLVASPPTNTAGTTFAGGPLPVAADFQGSAFPVVSGPQLNMSATNGKVALFSAVNTNLACGAELPGTLVDKVSWGSANCAETTATGALINTQGDVRNGGGIADTDNNLNDFTIVTTPVPHNSASPPNQECTAIPNTQTSWGTVKGMFK